MPAIVPLTGGPADLVVDNRTGYIIDTKDGAALLQTVTKHRGRLDRKQMRIAARDSVSMRTWQNIMDQLRQHYLQVIEQQSSRQTDAVGVA